MFVFDLFAGNDQRASASACLRCSRGSVRACAPIVLLLVCFAGGDQRASAAPPARTSCYCWFASLARISARVLLRLHHQPKHRCYLLLSFFREDHQAGAATFAPQGRASFPRLFRLGTTTPVVPPIIAPKDKVQGPDFSLILSFWVQMPLWEHKSAHRHMKALVQTKLLQNQSKTSE